MMKWENIKIRRRWTLLKTTRETISKTLIQIRTHTDWLLFEGKGVEQWCWSKISRDLLKLLARLLAGRRSAVRHTPQSVGLTRKQKVENTVYDSALHSSLEHPTMTASPYLYPVPSQLSIVAETATSYRFVYCCCSNVVQMIGNV